MTVGSWFHTDYDEAPVSATLPVEITSGVNPAIAIADQWIRGQAIVGRAIGEFGAIAVRVHGTGRPVRVTLSVGLDDTSTHWWSDRVKPPRFAPELPRLVNVRSQGRVRGAVVLARRQGWRGAAPANATLRFDLAAGEVDDDGLIVAELGEAVQPSWAQGRFSARSAIGLRLNSMSLAERDSTELTVGEAGYSGCDFAVVQPGGPTRFRLELSAAPSAPPVRISPRNRITKQKPARAVFKLSRAAHRVAVRSMSRPAGEVADVLAADLLTGEPIGVRTTRKGGGVEIRLDGPLTGPALVGSATPQPAQSWRLVPLEDS